MASLNRADRKWFSEEIDRKADAALEGSDYIERR
jgi:hypothetical protein